MQILRNTKLFDNKSKKLFELTFNKFKTFLDCSHCFYLDVVKGINLSQKNESSLDILVKKLLKKEFNYYREKQLSHSIFKLIDFKGTFLNFKNNNILKKNIKGDFEFIDNKNNFILRSYVDDIWIDEKKENILIVKYKIISEKNGVSEAILNDKFYKDLLIHIDFNNWLFSSSYTLNKYSYIMFINAIEANDFNKKLNFDYKFIKYFHKIDWIEKKILEIKNFLVEGKIPNKSQTCFNCNFSRLLNKF
jgi:hypothetical protein